jgi:predicted nucleic acid-binding protein
MAKRLLDSNILINHWHSYLPQIRTEKTMRQWAKNLIQTHSTNCICSPVEIELLAGTRSQSELKLHRAYLEAFHNIDGGTILKDDWQLAKQIAERVPRDGKPRDLGDCLIEAIAARRHYEVLTGDRRFHG